MFFTVRLVLAFIHAINTPYLHFCLSSDSKTEPKSTSSHSKQTRDLNPLTTNDDYSRHRNSAACYQLAQSVLKIGSALAERVGQGGLGGATAVADRAWWLLQLAIEKARSALDGPLFCFLVQTGVENGPFTL